MAVAVQREDFDPGALIAQVSATGPGAVASFVGLVRDDGTDEKGALVSLELDHYPAMTVRALEAIETEARTRWPLLDVLIVHRFGVLKPGERIVGVAVAASHRAAAFDACAFLMDWLKTKAPFWKRETYANGHTGWVAARTEDDARAAAWSRR